MPVLFSKEEHQAFLQGIKKHHRNWLLIQSEFLPNKTILQIRQYALDYFTVLKRLKVETKPHEYTSALEELDEEGDASMPPTAPTNFSTEALATSFFSMPKQLEYWKQFISNKQPQQQNPMQHASMEEMKQYLLQMQQEFGSKKSLPEEEPTTTVQYEKLYTLINGLMDPFHFDPIPIYQQCNAKEKEVLQIALHRLSITISGKLFHEKYTKEEQESQQG